MSASSSGRYQSSRDVRTKSQSAARWQNRQRHQQEVAMRPDQSFRSVNTPARFVIAAAVLVSLLLAALPASAQPPGVDHRRGQAAVAHLGARLPAVAAQHSMAPARLRELFLSDPYLAVDEADNLLFIDEFVPDEADPAPAPTVGSGGGPRSTCRRRSCCTACRARRRSSTWTSTGIRQAARRGTPATAIPSSLRRTTSTARRGFSTPN